MTNIQLLAFIITPIAVVALGAMVAVTRSGQPSTIASGR
jgi:hypothetical protein